MLALGISLLMILVYIWFRFEWQFAVGAVATLMLDITKTIGFLALTRHGVRPGDGRRDPDRSSAIRPTTRSWSMTGCARTCASTSTMPLRELIDLSINETLNRTLGTSMTVFLASLPLALFGGEALSGFAWVMLFGMVVGTSSSIFIAAPILLFLGEHRLRRDAQAAKPAKAKPAT